MIKSLGKVFVAFVFTMILFNGTIAEASVFNNKVSEKKKVIGPEVNHIQQSFQSGSVKEFVNVLDVKLSNTYTNLELGLPNPINSLKTTSVRAKENSFDGHQVVGAVNASFFMSDGQPSNLLAINNEIINYGILGTNTESPTQSPVAFGISSTGKAIADYFTTDLTFKVNGKEYKIDRINNTRPNGTTVLYTPKMKSTETGVWGLEIIVTSATQNMKNIHFGDHISGKVVAMTNYGESGNSNIPADGFVISVQSKDVADELKKMIEIGSTIELDLEIDDKWMNAEYILAGGPLLVKNGKPNISMPTTTSFVKGRNPRTAVAIDASGTRVFLVTVDGRQSHSNGTSLTDLASYLISLGATSAINLDGGGSTTMVVREPGYLYPSLVNKPSDGVERRVSTILQVVNTAPVGKVKSFKILNSASTVIKDASIKLDIVKAYDEYYNPVTINPNDVNWTIEGNIGQISNGTFTATKQGKGKILAEYQGVKAEVSVEVLNGDVPIVLDSFDSISNWKSESIRSNTSIGNSTKYEAFRQGKSSLKLSYDFTATSTGTTASYAVTKTPIPIIGLPKNLGVWVYGYGGNHWLRGVIIDGNGKEHTINFTEEGGLNWTGWKYVTASIPQDIQLPIKFERIYIAQPKESLQNKGKIYIDQLQSVYKEDYKEPVYTDVSKEYWANTPISYLNELGLIKGYVDGTFKPDNSITRAEAATIIARELNLKATKTPQFSDVKTSFYAYNAIAAVSEKGIITGRSAGKFSPDGKLTRAEMATILTRAYSLSGSSNVSFKDVTSKHWAHGYIQTLLANDLTSGYNDNTYRPNVEITRAEFATLLARVLKNK
ncbi:S-layer homology domain-containing protein [Ureibacillus sp. MALMAid1270]|uniref:S-layer homology domain-containing protein n=1 Tax=Ureibacillus sp. MALMAid1270 TaxID=3411629 RepID=UPI003BA559F5